MTDLPIVHPERPGAQIRPFKALHHFRKLIADKEDTEQVFHITDSLRSNKFVKEATSFLQSAEGQRLRQNGEVLPDILDDHDVLWAMPAGSLGRAYVAFMEKEGLSANGLVDESLKFAKRVNFTEYEDQMAWFNHRLRDTHDMVHILTGYGRDPLGEQCVLAFSYSQNFSLGFYFIAYAGGLEVKRRAPSGSPIFKAIRQAELNGRKAKVIGYQDITALLPLPIEEVRARLGIAAPTQYLAAHARFDAAGVSAHDMLEQAA